MMKKIVVGFLAISLIFGSTGFPKKKNNKNNTKITKKEKKRKKKAKRGVWDRIFGKREKKAVVGAPVPKKKPEGKLVKKTDHAWRYEKSKKEKLADKRRRAKKDELVARKKKLTVDRKVAMDRWESISERELAEDHAAGMNADLYKRPAWPFYALFAHNKDLLNVSLKYDYATTAFNASGGSQDLSRLYFGEGDFTFADILLASRLIKKGLAANNQLLGRLIDADGVRDKKLIFHAEADGYGASIDFARYLKGTDVFFGFQVPFGYKAHRLKLNSDVRGYDRNNQDERTRYEIPDILDYILRPKGMSYLPKMSIVGIGDISTFLSMQINTKFVERLIVGLRALWPTSKDPDTQKLWAPKLGEGFTTLSWYGSVLFHKQRSYFNPHMMMEFAYSLPDHKKRRVPKKIVNTQAAARQHLSDEDFAHGDKIQTVLNRTFDNEWDSLVPAFADNVKSVRITSGPQIFVRIGNIIEKFIYRRAFLDIFYDFRAKFKDRIGSGLTRDLWNVDVLKEDTHQLAHRIGADFTYQFDAKTRLQTGFKYTFDGINVPELFEFNVDVNVEF